MNGGNDSHHRAIITYINDIYVVPASGWRGHACTVWLLFQFLIPASHQVPPHAPPLSPRQLISHINCKIDKKSLAASAGPNALRQVPKIHLGFISVRESGFVAPPTPPQAVCGRPPHRRAPPSWGAKNDKNGVAGLRGGRAWRGGRGRPARGWAKTCPKTAKVSDPTPLDP